MVPLHSRCEVGVLGTPLRDQGQHRDYIRGRAMGCHSARQTVANATMRRALVARRSSNVKILFIKGGLLVVPWCWPCIKLRLQTQAIQPPARHSGYAPEPTAAGKIGEASSRCGRAT